MDNATIVVSTSQSLSQDELKAIDAYWRAANYLSVGQICLLDNRLLQEPLTLEEHPHGLSEGEFSIAYDEGRLIGVLEGSGGITTQLPAMVESFGKDTGAVLIYERDPKQLIEALIAAYSASHFKHPSCFCADSAPADG